MANVSPATLVELLRFRAEHQPDQTAFAFLHDGEQGRTHWTYAELDEQARRIAAILQYHGATHERVLLLYPPGLDYIAAFFGCLYAGAIAVPAYPPRNKRHLPRIRTIAKDAQARMILTISKMRSKIQVWLDRQSDFASLEMLITDQLTDGVAENWRESVILPEQLAFLQYTSGSTSLPKGVMVSHRNLMHNLTAMQDFFRQTPESRCVSWLPPYHDMGLIGGIMEPIFVGYPVILMSPASFLQYPIRWLHTISQHKASISVAPNFAYDLCVYKITPEQRASLDLSSWKVAINGAEPVNPDTLERFTAAFAPQGFCKEAFYPCYGLAEATLFVTGMNQFALPTIASFDAEALQAQSVRNRTETTEKYRTFVGVGQSISEQKLVIADPESFTMCAPDRIGEIWVAGQNVTQGYWNRPEATSETFRAYLADTGEGPFMRTGDLGFLKNGELFITGRLKDLIIVRGHNHYPQDIEWTVEQCHPAIRKNCCAAFAVAINGEEQLIIAVEVERRYASLSKSTTDADADGSEYRRPRDPEQIEIESGFSQETQQPPDIKQIIASIRQAVAEHHEIQASAIMLLKATSIPKTSSGKIQRHACKADFLAQNLDVIAEWRTSGDAKTAAIQNIPEIQEESDRLSGAWERFIAQLWAETLDVDQEALTNDANFFRLGGDSLHATTLIGRLSDVIGVELDPDLLHQNPTLSALATYCEEEYGMPPTRRETTGILSRYQQFCHRKRADFPLLPLQQSFFIGRQIGDVAIYVVLDSEIIGNLDLALFRKSLHLLIKRHPALRLAFAESDEGPRQQIAAIDDIRKMFSCQDVSNLSPQETQARIDQEIAALVKYRFNNHIGETFRAKLLTVNSNTHRLLLNFDHLAIDGFSLTKWFEDLHLVYRLLRENQLVEDTPQTALSFKDYVEIHTARQEWKRDMAYWVEKIENYEPFPPIGDDIVVTEGEGFSAHYHLLDPQLVKQLHDHARAHGVTFFSILMAGFFKLLSLWTGAARLTINTPHLNRRPYSSDVQDVLGCFTDILPIRVDYLLDEELPGVIQRVHQALSEMHRHSGVSGVNIARLLAQKQHATPEAISPIIFSSALFHLSAMSSPDTYSFSSIRVCTGAPATWLDVIVYEAGGEFVCSWNFLRKKFSPEKIAALAMQYESLLKDFAQQLQQANALKTLLHYADFAVWYQRYQEHQTRERHFTYWRQRLAGFPVLQLPTDFPPSPTPGERKALHSFRISKSLRHDLLALSEQCGAPLLITLLAAFHTLLYRYTTQTDIAVGFLATETENLSENLIVLRTELSANSGFRDLVKRLQECYDEADAYRSIPLKAIFDELLPDQREKGRLLLPAIYAYEPSRETQTTFAHLKRSEVDYTLFLLLQDAEDGVTGTWYYNADLFEAATIERAAGHLLALLHAAAASPDKSVATLPLLTEAEYGQIMEEWNATDVAYPLEQCVHQLFEAQVEKTPDAAALVFEHQHLTYRELNARANQLAHYLRRHGVGPEALVGISVERSFEMVIGLLGILKAGGAYVPMDPEYPQDRLTFMLEDSRVPILLTQQRLRHILPEQQAKIVCLDTDWSTIAEESTANPVSGVTADNMIYILYTSGSTGRPKGAINHHRGLTNRILWMQDAYHLTPADNVMQKTPFSFDVSGWEFYWPLIIGSRLVIAKPGGHKDSAYLVKLIREQNITTMHFVPPMLQVFLEEPGVEMCATLKRVICSGEALPYELQERFFEKFGATELHNLYGPTEAAIDVTYWECLRHSQRHIVPIGKPIANTQMYVLDALLQPTPISVPGELHIGGVNVGRGYLNRPELTQEKFIPDPFSADPAARLYKTGDLSRFLPDGNIEYLGRLDHQVKIRGFRIELGEIEAVLNSHENIKETVVLAREDHIGEKRLVAYLTVRQKPAPSIGELRSYLEERVPDYMVPAAFVVLDAFPLNPNGKFERKELPAPETYRQTLETPFVTPQSAMEQTIAAIWQNVLHLERVGVHDNFFELGGHSLLAVQIHHKLQETLGQDISVVELFQYPTIHALAGYLSQKYAEQPATQAQPERGEPRSSRAAAMQQRRQTRQQHRAERATGENTDE